MLYKHAFVNAIQRSPASNAFYSCSLTSNPAIPCPVPIHILVTRTLLFVLLATLKIVQICLAPVAPRGCPRAIAPPIGLTFAWSSPNTFKQYTAIDANASLISKMSMSSFVSWNLLRSFGIATEGPIPMMRGGTPATVAPQNLARMGWPSSMALDRFIRRTAAADRPCQQVIKGAALEETYLR